MSEKGSHVPHIDCAEERNTNTTIWLWRWRASEVDTMLGAEERVTNTTERAFWLRVLIFEEEEHATFKRSDLR